MSNLNFESLENVTKNTSSKSSKKPTKKKQKPPMGVIIGVGIAVILGIVFLFSGGGKSLKRLPKPDSYMQGKLVESARTMNVPASEIWKFYCNHDPEGYLR